MAEDSKLTRRGFLTRGAQIAGGALGAAALASLGLPGEELPSPYGPMQSDPAGVIDLPAGFSYTAFSPMGAPMDDGLLTPGAHDGMAAFPGPKGSGTVILVRNHEQDLRGWSPYGKGSTLLTPAIRSKLYDGAAPCLGGTTTLVYDLAKKALTKSFLSLGGTARNCSGGPTPWGSWLTCEESVVQSGRGFSKDHGWVFEVPASATGLTTPPPLKALGRFNHEGVAVDAKTGVLYLTEDRGNGLLYRFLPTKPGELQAGGRLQALRLHELPGAKTENWRGRAIPLRKRLAVSWVDLEDVESPKDDLRAQGAAAGAATFTRGEGIFAGGEGIYFACTDGGLRHKGQLWLYRPGKAELSAKAAEPCGTLELVAEPNDPVAFDNIDNLTVAPWGDVIAVEDGPRGNGLLGVTPAGVVYPIGRYRRSVTELAGPTFSPDGSTLFVNAQFPGLTLAITGPWRPAAGPAPAPR
jgi:uncharacterized protein